LDMERHHALGVILNGKKRDRKELDGIIREIDMLFDKDASKADVVNLLTYMLPGFHHIETGLNLDQKM
jgi:hypothetical protein